jgi:hypothetical protein
MKTHTIALFAILLALLSALALLGLAAVFF